MTLQVLSHVWSAGQVQRCFVSTPKQSQLSTVRAQVLPLFLNYCHFHAFGQAKGSFSLLQDTIRVSYLPLCNHEHKACRQGPLTEV